VRRPIAAFVVVAEQIEPSYLVRINTFIRGQPPLHVATVYAGQ